MATDMDTSIEDIEDINMDNSSPTLIDVIDLTKESPRPSQSHAECTASASPYVTRSSIIRRTLHRDVVLPIVLGRRQNQTDFPPMRRRMHNNNVSNEIVNLDDTVEDKKDEEADKQEADKQEAEKYYTFQSDNKMPVSLTCPICLETLSSSLQPTSTRCGHIFCAKCLKESIHKYKNCPTCKSSLKLKSCIRLYL